MLEKEPSGFGKRLQVTLCPADSLTHGDFQRDRLLIIELSGIAVGNTVAGNHGIRRKSTVLRQRGIFPTVFHQFVGKKEAGALNTGGKTEQRSGAVLQTDGTQPMQRIGGGDPVFVKVLGVAV